MGPYIPKGKQHQYKKQIVVFRSFELMVADLDSLKQSVTPYAAWCGLGSG